MNRSNFLLQRYINYDTKTNLFLEEMIYFFDRLDKFMKHRGLNDNKITVEVGISNGLIGKARNRGSLSQENISKILCTYPDLNADWLLTGKGEMLTNSSEKVEPSKEDRLLIIIESQQRTIEELSKKIK